LSPLRNVVLIGFMGSGKSTIGRALAHILGRPFVDTDVLIEESSGMTISDIFSQMGERAFREMESEAVRACTSLHGTVVAVGGGAVEDEDTRRLLKDRCIVVLLEASDETILSRIERCEDRPLLAGLGREEKLALIRRLVDRRLPAYRDAASLVVNAEGPIDFIARRIASSLADFDSSAGGGSTSNGGDSPPEVHGIQVSTPTGSYNVHVGAGLLKTGGDCLRNLCGDEARVFLVSNPLVSQLWSGHIEQTLRSCGCRVERALVGDGEKHKTLATASLLYDALVSQGHDRESIVVALGGGVVGDLAGFVAATFMRGLRLIQVPTTLLSQVDSSIGGKTGVNHPLGKNMIGAFHQPVLVLSDVNVLQTLPSKVFSDGLAEVVKTAIIAGEALFGSLERDAASITCRRPEALREMVAACVRVKARVVSRDERDWADRMVLNLGHTFGHALEAACGYEGVSHGEAVSLGMCMALRLSSLLGVAEPHLAERVAGLLRLFGLPTRLSELRPCPHPEDILSHLASDKKRRRGRLRFILPVTIGDVRVVDDVPYDLIEQVVNGRFT